MVRMNLFFPTHSDHLQRFDRIWRSQHWNQLKSHRQGIEIAESLIKQKPSQKDGEVDRFGETESRDWPASDNQDKGEPALIESHASFPERTL
jgi:hypothetical protein